MKLSTVIIIALSPVFAVGCKIPKNTASPTNSVVAANEYVASTDMLKESCNLRRNGASVEGFMCTGATLESSSCCAMDEGCVRSGRGKGQCFACADEEGDLLCDDRKAEHGYICCDSNTQVCGTHADGCGPI